MAGPALFDVRFDLNGRQRGENPFKFHGMATLAIEPDFITLRGRGRRVFRPEPEQEQRLRMVDIVNVRSDGELLSFDVLGVKDDLTITFEVPDREALGHIMALLPARQTEAFAVAEADRELFHDRIDHWTPSTPVIWTLLTLNIAVYVLMWFDRAGAGSAVGESIKLVRWGSNVGPLTLGGQWWRLVTSMFLHGSLLHIAFNMFALYQVGRLVERMFGSLRFIALYMLAGVAGSLASVLWNPHVNSVGASGAIFGIIGGLFAFMRRPDSGVPPTIIKEVRGSLGGFLMFNIAAGLIYPHTDNAAHIGGLVGGYLAGFLLARSLHVPGHAHSR